MRGPKRFPLLVVVLLLPGCAIMVIGTHQNVPVVSDPPGARITVTGEDETVACTTPCTLRLSRSSEMKKFNITLQGHETATGNLIPGLQKGPLLLATLLADTILVVPIFVDMVVLPPPGEFNDYPEKIEATLPQAGSGRPDVRLIR
jgi:hypothetical protein